MSRRMQRAWQSARDIVGTWGLALILVIAGLLAAYQFVGPAPPTRIMLSTGEPGGAYQRYGELYAQRLERDGIHVELQASAGSVDNLDQLKSGAADIAFVQSGLTNKDTPDNVVALGSLYLEPLWLFLREGLTIEDLGDLAGARINVGPEGSGTRPVALTLLGANGIDSGNATLSDLPGSDLVAAFTGGELDAVLLVASPEAEAVAGLLRAPGVRLFDFQRIGAYARVYRFLSPVLLPEGVLDLDADLPDQDIHTIAASAMLAASDELHPALVDLLLVAADDIHGGSSLLSDAGEFPSRDFIDLPLSAEAARHFEFGPPFLMRYLPFWAATLVDRLWVMLLPLLGLAIPLIKFVPPVYHWRVRGRLLRMYDELDTLDPAQTTASGHKETDRRLERLEAMDREVALLPVPRGYTDAVYKLRRDVDLVRRRLNSGSSRIDQADSTSASQ